MHGVVCSVRAAVIVLCAPLSERLVSAVCCIFALNALFFMCALELFVGIKDVRATASDVCDVFRHLYRARRWLPS